MCLSYLFYGRHLFQPPRQEHWCSAPCSAPGICQIDTTLHSIEATSSGRLETFQCTKVCPSLLGWELMFLSYVSIRKVCSPRLCITFLRVRCFRSEASSLRQDYPAWRGRASRFSYSQQRKAAGPLLREPVSQREFKFFERLLGIGVRHAITCARFLWV